MEKQHKRISKLLSLVLRHEPASIGIQLDENGWVEVASLLRQMNLHGNAIDLSLLEMIVATSDKQRFAFNEAHTAIRANQGHSVAVDLNLSLAVPPDLLFHGTADHFLQSILKDGLKRQERQHVHLSSNETIARSVGARHGKPVILNIHAGRMHADGFEFYLSDNGVWLVAQVPVQYIQQ